MNTTILAFEIDEESLEVKLDNGTTYLAPIDEDINMSYLRRLCRRVRDFLDID